MINSHDLAYHYGMTRLHAGDPDDVALDQWFVALARMRPSEDGEIIEDEIGRARLYTLDIDLARGAGELRSMSQTRTPRISLTTTSTSSSLTGSHSRISRRPWKPSSTAC